MLYSGASGGSYGTNANWTDSAAGGIPFAPGLDGGFTGTDSATFGSTSGSVTVNLDGSSPSLAAVTFNGTGNYTLAQGSGGTLTLAASGFCVAGSHMKSMKASASATFFEEVGWHQQP